MGAKTGSDHASRRRYYRETYRAELTFAAAALPARYGGPRAASTTIYFLLEGRSFSALHRLRSDEVWHFYTGSCLLVHVFEPDGRYRKIRLGLGHEAGEAPQAVVKGGCWFGARVEDGDAFSLVGCTVAPGFDFADFELAGRTRFLRLYPQHIRVVEDLTRS